LSISKNPKFFAQKMRTSASEKTLSPYPKNVEVLRLEKDQLEDKRDTK